MKKYLLLAVAIILLGGGSYFTERSFLASSATAPQISASTTTTEMQPAPAARAPAIPVEKPADAPEQTLVATPSATPTPDVTVAVAGTSYAVYAPPGSTVLDAMNILASTTPFTFTSKNFPGMGAFVESIDGKENAGGSYWFLYVNGKSAGTGASETRLKAGDTVEWRYEKNY
jgi:hypothetical protein